MKRILFVDDEVRLLEALQRMLRPQRDRWEMAFASSGAQALSILEKQPFDVIVTDMRMPEMDGARLLECVQEKFPSVVRIVLSGYFETGSTLNAVPVAHRFLAKPCDPEELRDAIERACNFTAILPDETIRHVVGAVGQLPALPATCLALADALRKPNIGLSEIAHVVERDVGITAKVLQLVNSAFFGPIQEITSVSSAVGFLGLDTLRQLVLSAEIFRVFAPSRRIEGFSIDRFQAHCRLAARIAARLHQPGTDSAAPIVASMLHDVGKLVLAAHLADQFELVLAKSAQERRTVHDVETEMLGTSHAQIGAYLLGLWGLPNPVVTAVCCHHQPLALGMPEKGLNVLAITHIADALSEEASNAANGFDGSKAKLLDLDYVEAIGATGRLAEWRELAAEVCREPAGD